jgi:hypothetical protein
MRRGMGIMGMVLSYGVLLWMLLDLPLTEVLVTWSIFAVFGGVLTMIYEVWARRKYARTLRPPRRLARLEGVLLWPAMIPDAVGLMLTDAGISPADERSESHAEDHRRITGESPASDEAKGKKRTFYEL